MNYSYYYKLLYIQFTNYDQYEQMVQFLMTDIATGGITSVCYDT
jgi:hypothetical protein